MKHLVKLNSRQRFSITVGMSVFVTLVGIILFPSNQLAAQAQGGSTCLQDYSNLKKEIHEQKESIDRIDTSIEKLREDINELRDKLNELDIDYGDVTAKVAECFEKSFLPIDLSKSLKETIADKIESGAFSKAQEMLVEEAQRQAKKRGKEELAEKIAEAQRKASRSGHLINFNICLWSWLVESYGNLFQDLSSQYRQSLNQLRDALQNLNDALPKAKQELNRLQSELSNMDCRAGVAPV